MCQQRVLLLLFLQSLFFAVSNGKLALSYYTVKKDTKTVASHVDVLYGLSSVACAGLCESSHKCNAVNYHLQERVCYLYNKSCFVTEDAPGWSFLKPREPERQFIYISDQTKTYDDAKAYCESRGWLIANIPTTCDYHTMLNQVVQMQNPISVWVGGRNIGGYWYWSNNVLLNEQNFNFWATGQPDNPLQNCLQILDFGTKVGLDDDFCLLGKHFMCENVIY